MESPDFSPQLQQAAETPPAQAQAVPQSRRTDYHIWGIYIMLCMFSIVELYSASAHEIHASNVFAPVMRHVFFLLIGLALMIYLQNVHYKRFLRWSYGFAAISFVACVYSLFFGETINGATRSFSIGIANVQPAEMVKLSVVLLIACFLSKAQAKGKSDITDRGMYQCVATVGVASLLLFSQGLTNTLLLGAIALSMMLVGGVSTRRFFLILGAFIILGCCAIGAKVLIGYYKESKAMEHAVTQMAVPGTDIVVDIDANIYTGRQDTWKSRITRHLSNDKHLEPITDVNRQEQYSYLAQAHGGVLGVMPGNSRETARLPLAFSDYIYAIVIEEMGLWGGILVLLLYLWLLARAGRVANRCQTAFPALLVIGMAVFIVYQAIFHMCIVTGVFPVSGQPLPLISKGGTSIIITSIALGIMLSVSRFAARKGQRTEIRDELAELPPEVAAANPT